MILKKDKWWEHPFAPVGFLSIFCVIFFIFWLFSHLYFHNPYGIEWEAIEAVRSRQNSIVIVVGYDPEMKHLKESNYCNGCFKIKIKDKQECDEFQEKLKKFIQNR